MDEENKNWLDTFRYDKTSLGSTVVYEERERRPVPDGKGGWTWEWVIVRKQHPSIPYIDQTNVDPPEDAPAEGEE